MRKNNKIVESNIYSSDNNLIFGQEDRRSNKY